MVDTFKEVSPLVPTSHKIPLNVEFMSNPFGGILYLDVSLLSSYGGGTLTCISASPDANEIVR